MTKDEVKQKYHTLAAQAGDLYFRVEQLRDTLKAAEAQLAECRKQKHELEQAFKDASDESEAVVEPSAPSAE